MANSIYWTRGTVTNLAGTALASLANGSGNLLDTAFDNSAALYTNALIELRATFGTNPTEGNLVNLYLIPALDGTVYSYAPVGASPYISPSMYLGGFSLDNVTTIQTVVLGIDGAVNKSIEIPPTLFKLYALNNSGQAFPAAGGTVNFLPYNRQVV